MVIRGLVFDLDDTLYLERDYVRSGFRHVAGLAGTSADEERDIADWLEDAFENGTRGDTFERLIAARPWLSGRVTSADLVLAYRSHVPTISLAPGVVDLLDRISKDGLRLGVLSDGPLPSQRAKVQALGLDRWFDPIVLTSDHGEGFAKPGTRGFERITATWGLPGREIAYVADNPVKDFVAPRKLGWLTVRLRLPGQLYGTIEPVGEEHRADIELSAVVDLLEWLRKSNNVTLPAAHRIAHQR